MRARTTLLAFFLSAVPALCIAQHTHQFEFGGFGSYTRYDKAFVLAKQVGGGGRLGYFFSRVVGIEFEMGYQQPTPYAGGNNATATLASGSLVFNTGNEHNLFYVLGGYTRLEFSDRPGYTFSDNAVHGAIGDRLFLGGQVALRIEGRAIYAPTTRFSSGNWAGHIVGSAGLSIFTGPYAVHDADLDGVSDRKDACSGTPTGAVVDARGCPSDSDRDQVFNGIDACPNTVEGAEVDARGCPKDTDSDGVPDGIDKCPNTPARTEVDSAGCQRSSDTDGDGIDDTKDKCPGTAAGTRVDAAGCPILFTEAKTPVVLRGVTFETGRSALKPDSYTILDIVAASLVANADIRIEIGGHTDNTGASATNLRLSQARADAVRAYLASKGVGPERMVSKGYGASQPVAPNTTATGRAQNRRVELRQTN